MEKAKGDWVLFLDADEIVSEDLAKEIADSIEKSGCNGYFMLRRDILWEKELKYGETGSKNLMRLAKRDFGRIGNTVNPCQSDGHPGGSLRPIGSHTKKDSIVPKLHRDSRMKKARNSYGEWKRKVHEYWDISGKKAVLKNHLLHYPHKKLREFIRSIDHFSSIHAVENQTEYKESSLIKIIIWPLGKFIINYLFKLGILDGVHGFVHSLLMSFHSFLSWSKLWLIQRKRLTN